MGLTLFLGHLPRQKYPNKKPTVMPVTYVISYRTQVTLFYFFAQGLVQCKWSWRQTVLTVLVSDLYLRLHFHKTDPLLILILCKKMLKHFQIGSFRVNWQTPIFQNGPQNGALNTWVGNFFIKRTLLTFFPAKMVLAGYLAKKSIKIWKNHVIFLKFN